MFNKSLVFALVATVVCASCPSQYALAGTELTLSPTTPWNLDGTNAGCALRRTFGTPERPVVLEFLRFRPGDVFQLSIEGADLAGTAQRDKVSIEYGDVFIDKDTPFQAGTSTRDDQKAVPSILLSSAFAQPEKTAVGVRSSHPLVTPAMEAAVRQITLAWGANRLTLVTGPLGKPFAALRSCTDDLVTSWGLDPAVQNALSHAARPANVPAMVRSIQAVYPKVLAARGKQGRVNFLALVDEQGAVTQCRTMQSYNVRAFDDLACNVVRKTRFEPALNKDGKPVASYYVETVGYVLG